MLVNSINELTLRHHKLIKQIKMKTNLKNLSVVLIATLMTLTVNARNFSEVVNVKTFEADKKALIRVNNEVEAFVSITIENENGTVVFYEENFKGMIYAKILNLKNLEEGNYKLTIRSGNDLVVKNLEVKNNEVVVSGIKTVVVNANYNSLKNLFHVEAKNGGKIKLYKSDSLVFEDYVNSNKISRYDLNLLEKGSYTAEILSDGSLYTYTLEVK